MRMKKHVFTITAIVIMSSLSYAAVSDQSAKLESLRRTVESGQGTLAEKEYLNAFPATFETFRKIFYGNENNLDELYQTHSEHLD